MGDAAVSAAVHILGNLLIEKVNFLQAVSGEVNLIKDELASMQSFLKWVAEKRRTPDDGLRTMVSEIRKLAFEAEDVIETFIHKENARTSRGVLMRLACWIRHVSNLSRVGDEVQFLLRKLKQFDQRRKRYQIPEHGVDLREEAEHRVSPAEEGKHVVGFQKDLETVLAKAILDERKDPFKNESRNSTLGSATIMGMAGTGKSTLAKMVYYHHAVVDHFDVRAWVGVSSECTPREIMKSLILQLLNEDEDELKMLETMEKFNTLALQEKVNERLREVRYLVVLDDVWEEVSLEKLMDAFPNNDKGSRLLLTSHNKVSTEYHRYTHSMETLNKADSLNLFLKKALIDYTDEVDFPEELKEVGRKILKKCDGLPLAIKAVGAQLLKVEQSKSAWEKVLERINHYLENQGYVSTIFELSYKNLPPRLKPCFLCLAFFNDNTNIPAKKLKNIWIAQGFIQMERDQTVEATATRYLDELIERNMIQVKDKTKDQDQIKNCKVSNLLYRLSIRKAEEEMGFEVIRGEGNSDHPSEKPRHRALHCGGRFRNDGKDNRNKHLRSLFISGNAGSIIHATSYWKDFELLRVLEMEGCTSVITLPEAIGAFVALRYMGLRATKIKKLPLSFRKLKNLQILQLPRDMVTPSFIWEMTSLRHINARPTWPKAPPEMSILNSLHTVKHLLLGSKSSNLELLAEMNNLCYLGIVMDASVDVNKLFSSFQTLGNLVRLSLTWHAGSSNMDGLGSLTYITRLKLHGQMSRLPTTFPPNLSHLTLKGSILDEDPMPLLEKLPRLSYLSLFKAYLGQHMVISGHGLPTLKVLVLRKLSELSSIQVGEGAMAKLKRFEITSCPDLNTKFLLKQLGSSVDIDMLKLFD